MRWAQITDKGLGREVNEDNMLVAPDLGLLAVADGMGGHRGGRTASKMALATLKQELTRLLALPTEPPKALQDAVKITNSAIFARASEFAALQGMGTTLTACLYREQQLYLAQVGDSRAYLSRGAQIRQVTQDHSLVQELVQKKVIRAEEALSHPQRHMLTRALGSEPFVEVDTFREQVQPGDRLLLCTDGLTRYLQSPEILEVLQTSPEPEIMVQTLLGRALQAGGADNITIVLACF